MLVAHGVHSGVTRGFKMRYTVRLKQGTQHQPAALHLLYLRLHWVSHVAAVVALSRTQREEAGDRSSLESR